MTHRLRPSTAWRLALCSRPSTRSPHIRARVSRRVVLLARGRAGVASGGRRADHQRRASSRTLPITVYHHLLMGVKVVRQGTGPDGNPFKIEDHTANGRKRRRIVCGPQAQTIIYVIVTFSGDDQAVFDLLLDGNSTGGKKFAVDLRAKGIDVSQLPRHPNGAVMVPTATSGPAVPPPPLPPATTIASRNRRTGSEAKTIADGQRFVRDGVVVRHRLLEYSAPDCWEFRFRRDHARERQNHGRGISELKRKIDERDVTITRLSRENVMLRASLEFALHRDAKVRAVRRGVWRNQPPAK